MSKYNVEYILNLKDRVSGQLKGIQGNVSKLDDKFASIGELAIGGGAIAGLTMLASKVVETTVEFQRFQTMLTTQFGSQFAAQSAFNKITEFASNTPYEVAEITDAFVKLNNRGIEPTTQQLTKVGDFAAAQGKGYDQLVEAILDVNNPERWKEFGVKASTAGDKVSLTFGKTTVEVERTVEGAMKAVEAFGQMEGIAGGMEAQSKTLGGQISNLTDSFDQLFFAIGNLATVGGEGSGSILGAIGKHIGNLTTVTGNFSKIWSDTDTGVAEKLLYTTSNLGDTLFTNLPFVSQFYDVSPYVSSHDEMLSRIDAARNAFTNLDETQKAYYTGMLAQEKYNSLWERNAQVMGMSIDKFKEYMGLVKEMPTATGAADSLETLQTQIKNLQAEQKNATDRATFMESQRQIDKIQGKINKITGKSTGGGGGARAGAGATSTTLTSRSPQTFNINITKLVETINTTKPQLNTTDSQTMRQITEALVMAVNDVQTTVQ
jgi:hypothetical protein